MKSMKPTFEKVNPEFGSSFSVKQYLNSGDRDITPFWHFHPELELVYVKGGSGKRHIGNHLSYFRDGDLIFMGANLPHTGFTDRLTRNESETVVQFVEGFAGENFFNMPEMAGIRQLFNRAKSGLTFKEPTRSFIGNRLEKLPQLNHFERFVELLNILQMMADSNDYEVLNTYGYTIEITQQDNDRIKDIYQFVLDNFQRSIALEEAASEVNMTVPAFCRFFKKHSGKTFTHFVNEVRVVHACKILTEKQISITEVSFESGFNNFSHFNKQFKKFVGKMPSEYRKDFKKIVK